MTTTPDDLQRSLGRVEGTQRAMRDDLTKIEKTLETINQRLASIEARESERKGAWVVLVTVASLLSGVFGAVFSWWLKGGGQ